MTITHSYYKHTNRPFHWELDPTLAAMLTASTLRLASRSAPLKTLPSLSTAGSAIVCTLQPMVILFPVPLSDGTW